MAGFEGEFAWHGNVGSKASRTRPNLSVNTMK